MKIKRNDPCPCGSGLKYKHCHLGKPLPGEDSPEARDIEMKEDTKRHGKILFVIGILLGIGAGLIKDDVTIGLTVFGAWTLGSLAYLSFRNPPPPNENAGDSAALNFGHPTDKK